MRHGTPVGFKPHLSVKSWFSGCNLHTWSHARSRARDISPVGIPTAIPTAYLKKKKKGTCEKRRRYGRIRKRTSESSRLPLPACEARSAGTAPVPLARTHLRGGGEAGLVSGGALLPESVCRAGERGREAAQRLHLQAQHLHWQAWLSAHGGANVVGSWHQRV